MPLFVGFVFRTGEVVQERTYERIHEPLERIDRSDWVSIQDTLMEGQLVGWCRERHLRFKSSFLRHSLSLHAPSEWGT